MTEDIQLKMEKTLAVIELYQPNSLILSQNQRNYFRSCIEKIIQSNSIHVALLIFKPKGFYLGEPLKNSPFKNERTESENSKHHYQIEQMEKIHGREKWEKLLDEVHELFDLMETANVSWVAAIQGACLGHLLELALTCDYRIADFKTDGFGLPDLSLELMPCFGACIRMPRLIGLRKALKMILNSQVISPREAYRIELIHKAVHPLDLEEQARILAKKIIKGHIPSKPRQQYKPLQFLDKCFEIPISRQILYYITKKKLLSETKGFYPAPLKVLEVIKNTYPVKNQKMAFKKESDAFCDLMVSSTTRHLISLHLTKDRIISNQYKKNQKKIEIKSEFGFDTVATKGCSVAKRMSEPFNSYSLLKNLPLSHTTSIEKLKKIAVIGAGTMGEGITHWLTHYPVSVLLKDIHSPSLSNALRTIHSQNIPSEKIRPQMDYSGFHNVDLVIETVVEDLEIKKKVIAETASHTSDKCLFATNTSSFKVTDLAKAHPDPNRFFGLHFFYPAYQTPLVEIVRGEHSSDDTLISAAQGIRKLDKIPFIVKDRPGFLVQRLFLPLMMEAFWFLKEGISIQQVDQIYSTFGFSMGPFRLMDELGVDICLKLIKSMQWQQDKDFPKDIFKLRPVFLGRKNKNGFYIYDKNEKVESVNNLIYKDLQFKPTSQNINVEECLERGIYRMVNEAAQVLEEQVVATSEELDLALVLGIGFPAFRGGLLKYADEVSLKTIVTKLTHLSKAKGERFRPSRVLLTQIDKGSLFYSVKK
ncbi:MAG: 3-hydroxyacyl-CoA dehydrogenase NAD-binding domain-containing protein [Bdellovibrionales bacterium]|nr:3-hydroxyacyl-CoA dehydrogenase NAD-binding domain-containing protein [Bdellovibrionales bacterium]